MKELYTVTTFGDAYITEEEEVVEEIEEEIIKEGEEELILFLDIFAEMINKLGCRRDPVQKSS
jgi:hypothetical protein